MFLQSDIESQQIIISDYEDGSSDSCSNAGHYQQCALMLGPEGLLLHLACLNRERNTFFFDLFGDCIQFLGLLHQHFHFLLALKHFFDVFVHYAL